MFMLADDYITRILDLGGQAFTHTYPHFIKEEVEWCWFDFEQLCLHQDPYLWTMARNERRG